VHGSLHVEETYADMRTVRSFLMWGARRLGEQSRQYMRYNTRKRYESRPRALKIPAYYVIM
jgi:hypothetical protein